MSKTVRGITIEQWSIVRKHLINDLDYGPQGTYLDFDSQEEEALNEKDHKTSVAFVAKMDRAFGVRFNLQPKPIN